MLISRKKVALLGLFGVGNFGNEASLGAMLQYMRQNKPEFEAICVCGGPSAVAEHHKIEAVSLHLNTEDLVAHSQNRIVRLFLRLLLECVIWLKTYRFLRNVDLVIVPGTGILDDFGVSPWQMPYILFRWNLLAKLARVNFYYVSIGAGPIHHPISRWLMKSAARLATYRSYRDTISKEFMESIGFATGVDPVYPDLVFGLPTPTKPQSAAVNNRVGLGVMAYYGWQNQASNGEEIYQHYLAKLIRFATWLLQGGYSIRFLVGETTDQRMVTDLQQALAPQVDANQVEQIVAEPIGSIQDLMEQLALTDLVVATRFHNVLCALMLNRPVISLGYARKNDVLLAEMGMGAYCQHVETFDVEQLKEQFVALEEQADSCRGQLCRCNEEYRQALAKQYSYIFG